MNRAPDGMPAYSDVSTQLATSSFQHAEFSGVGGVDGRLVVGLNDINNLKSLSGIGDPRLQKRVFHASATFQLPGP